MGQNREEIRRIMIAVNVIDGIYDMIAKKVGIKENTLALLYALDDGQPHSQKEICEEWLIPRTTLNTIVKECVEKELIFLQSDMGKKEKTVCLTKTGQALAKKILKEVYEVEEQAMERTLFSVSDEFIEGIEQFAKQLQEETRRYINESR
ncbi:MAG: MarR family transcriptional regulator [Clostridiales bacterium]|nr:MarR family transcriptional regulator [Clostridiales bacterium]